MTYDICREPDDKQRPGNLVPQRNSRENIEYSEIEW